MKFTKMQGAGNDYIYFNCFEEDLGNDSDIRELAIKLSERHFGIGADGIVLICPSEKADFRMRMLNADGSESQMCGNAARCVGKYVYDRGMTAKEVVTLETLGGIKTLYLTITDGKVSLVKVNMGKPEFTPARIPVRLDGEAIIDREISAGGGSYRITCVSMGNPHAVVFMEEDVDNLDIEHIGPLLEHDSIFPERANIEFVNVLNDKTLKMRVWERGTGETLACGTGACAVLAAAYKNGHTGRSAEIRLKGGELFLEWAEESECIFKTGGAAFVFDGILL